MGETHFDNIGSYRILRKLGEGSSGRVFLAYDSELGKEVALKVLHHGIPADRERFEKELKILRGIRHAHVVRIHDQGVEEGRSWYAMEFAGDRSLAGTKLPLREGVQIIESVAHACQTAHDHGILHLGLKPSNVILGDRPMVTDFGMTTRSGGAPQYMAPEQGESGKEDGRSDVYSIGVLLYEVMTGRLPFDAKTPVDLLKQIVDEPVEPRMIDPHLPKDLEVIVLKALAREPERRYATAGELAEDLRSWLDGVPISAQRPRIVERFRVFVSRKPFRAAQYGGAFCLLVLAVVMIVRYGLSRIPDVEQSKAHVRIKAAQRTLLAEEIRLQEWESAAERSPSTLRASERNILPLLQWDALTPALRYQANFLLARLQRQAGKRREARLSLDRAIINGFGEKAGEAYLARAQLTWEAALRENSETLRQRTATDLRAGLRAGFQDEGRQNLAAEHLALIEGRHTGLLRRLEELQNIPGKPSEQVFKLMGDFHLLAGQYDQAITKYREAVQVWSDYVEAMHGVVLAQMAKGELLAAYQTAAASLQREVQEEESCLLLASVVAKTFETLPGRLESWKQWEERLTISREILKKRSQLRSSSYPVHLAHGMTAMLLASQDSGQGKEADDVLLRATELREEEGVSWFARGVLLVLHGKDAGQAVRFLEKARSRDADNAQVYRWKGFAYEQAGSVPAAIGAWKAALEFDAGLKEELQPKIQEAKKK